MLSVALSYRAAFGTPANEQLKDQRIPGAGPGIHSFGPPVYRAYPLKLRPDSVVFA